MWVATLFFVAAFGQVHRLTVPDYRIGGSLWPYPESLKTTEQEYSLDPTKFSWNVTGESNQILTRAVQRYKKLAFPNWKETILNALEFHGPLILSLTIDVAKCDDGDQIQFGADESYTLAISAPTSILKSNTVWGALRGLETFSQLVRTKLGAYTIRKTSIQDGPRFGWRGLLIDTSRHWLPVTSILETIDAMSYNKLNTLHWHMVDGQSFPFESKVFPLLSEHGSYRADQVYKQSDIRAIISYANERGVRVLPEFDMPAHATSWGLGYPFMIVPCGSQSNADDFNDSWGDQPMDPTNPQVYEFIEEFIAEVSSLFPDHWLHLGGDEVPYNCWNTSSINAYMKEHNIDSYQKLETDFIIEINKRIRKFGKHTSYWQEVFQNTSPFIGGAVDVVWAITKKEQEESVERIGNLLLFSGRTAQP
eukprot:TRINITY_DN1208_c0_g1_i2.p1 TRINITY_DN1208_c0_g1~~TRINITY_DN1208_c0_g1_i2.p1  ORF type:complete len:421 (-),score=32.37 TRINITY_DN1208_c0_g1_i2:389-1651(-)